MKIANAEKCTIKTLPGVDTNLTGDYKIRAEDGLEMFKNYTRRSSQLLTIHNGGSETCHVHDWSY